MKGLSNANRFKAFSNEHFFKPTEEDLEKNPDCVICRDANDMESSRVMPCGHVLHEECLKSWLLQKDQCPMCNHSLFDFEKEAEMRKQTEPTPLQKALEDISVQQAIRNIQNINMHNLHHLFLKFDLNDEEELPFYIDLSLGHVVPTLSGGSKDCYLFDGREMPLKDVPWKCVCDDRDYYLAENGIFLWEEKEMMDREMEEGGEYDAEEEVQEEDEVEERGEVQEPEKMEEENHHETDTQMEAETKAEEEVNEPQQEVKRSDSLSREEMRAKRLEFLQRSASRSDQKKCDEEECTVCWE